jgi:hypothetical protein
MHQLLDKATPEILSPSETRWAMEMRRRLIEREGILRDQRALPEHPTFDPQAVYARNVGHEDHLNV